MAIKYLPAPDIDRRIRWMARLLELGHIDERVICMRAVGSRARWTLARCHTLPKILQVAMGVDAHYVIEVIAEQFDDLGDVEQDKTLIHELLHIPRAFGGGLKSERFVNSGRVNRHYKKFKKREAEWLAKEQARAARPWSEANLPFAD